MKVKNANRNTWSFRLGRMLGVDVYVHFTFLLLLGFIGVAHGLAGRSVDAALTGVLFFAGIFLCVLLHEFGHALAARRYGIKTTDITLLPIGGLARLERIPEKPAQELVVALAGPAVNVVIAAGLAVGLWLGGYWQTLSSLSLTGGNLFERLLLANVFLVGFNLIPAFPMDGGRVLRSLLAMRLGPVRATNLAAAIGKGIAVVFGFVGLFTNPMLLLIALFVWIGASQEAAAVEMKSAFDGVPVREAMLTQFETLSPRDDFGRCLANSPGRFAAGFSGGRTWPGGGFAHAGPFVRGAARPRGEPGRCRSDGAKFPGRAARRLAGCGHGGSANRSVRRRSRCCTTAGSPVC